MVRGVSHHASARSGLIQFLGHVQRVSHRNAKHQGSAPCRVASQTAPLVDDKPGAHLIAGDQRVYGRQFRLFPGHLRRIGVVIASVVLEGAQKLQIEGMPKP